MIGAKQRIVEFIDDMRLLIKALAYIIVSGHITSLCYYACLQIEAYYYPHFPGNGYGA